MSKLLIIRPGALGDTLMLLPSVIYLGSNMEISLAGRFPGLSFLKPWVRGYIDLDGPLGHRLFSEENGERPRDIPDSDVVVAFIKDQDGLVGRNLHRWFPQASTHFFPSLPPVGEKRHVSLHVACCLQQASLPINPMEAVQEMCRRPPFKVSNVARGRETIVFHPGSGSRTKNYPPGFWTDLVARFKERVSSPGVHMVFLLGPAEEPLYPCFGRIFAEECIKPLVSLETETLVSLLQNTTLYIGHDSGVTHLAAMHGISTIALFRDSSVEQWKPLGPNVRVIFRREADARLIEEIIRLAKGLMSGCGGLLPKD